MDKGLANQAPLTGIRVVDFGHYIAGPAAGMLLADQGAEVVKIDRPGRPVYDSPVNAVLNRNKKQCELDLKTPEGLKTARKLVLGADVVIENFRPGVMQRLGLGPDEMTTVNPRLIYLSLPGFLSSDKGKASIRAFEGVISAATALFTDIEPERRRLLGAPPVYTPLPAGSAYAAAHGALAVILALYHREQTGRGDVIEVPLAGANMSSIGGMILRAHGAPRRYATRPSWRARHITLPLRRWRLRKLSEAERKVLWREVMNEISPFYDNFLTGDGKWVFLLARGNARLSVQLTRALGIYQELLDEGMVDRDHYKNLSLDNNIQEAIGWSKHWNARVREKMTAVFKTKSAAEWTKVMAEYGVAFHVNRTAQEWLNASEPAAAAITVTVDDPVYGPLRQPGLLCSLSRTPENWLQPKPMQRLKGDPGQLWAVPEVGAEGTGGPEDPKSQILAGIRVLDLSTVLAGPTGARTLAEFGADVIKIDPPNPNFGPRTHCFQPMEVSQGKRSLILDIKSEEGLKIFYELAKGADIIVTNMSPGTPNQLGIDYTTLTKLNPGIIFLHLTAYAGHKPGPWGELKGFDPVLQAAMGIQTRYSGAGNKPILHGWASCIDYLTGYIGALGVALALFKRARSGEGDLARTSLALAGQLVQIAFMYSSEKYSSGDEPSGQEALGEHSLQHLYQAKDGWLYLGGLKSELPRLKAIPSLASVPSGEDEERERIAFLETAIKKRSVGYWVGVFNQAGLGSHRVDTLQDIREAYLHKISASAAEQEWFDGRSISITRMVDHPCGYAVDNVAPTYARFRNSEVKLGKPLPRLGTNTREILKELGYPDEQIEDWLSAGVVRESFGKEYLPA